MSTLISLTEELRASQNLGAADIATAATALAEESVAAEEKMDFLSALADKGETAEEIAAFAREFRARAVDPQ
ncbi:anthranilate phosphoribosyltransferase, partial [bacterium]|nr:anthranilate phosphoribosyltransferase [bacterium]